MSRVRPLPPSKAKRILDFDLETFAAGFADPAWVPQKITCISWSWLDEEEVKTSVCGQQGFWIKAMRRRMMEPFHEALMQADILTGHNIARFDLGVWNAECLRVGLPVFRGPVGLLDTMKIAGKPKGFKKGLDNLAVAVDSQERKQALNWQEWDDAYEDPTWQTIIDRCESDVRMHKEVLALMQDRDMLVGMTTWKA